MDKKSEKCNFFSYRNENNAYQLYNPKRKKLII